MAFRAKVVVYVSSTQPQWPSSVVNRRDRSVRQKQEPTRYRTERSKHMIYLQPCDEHDPETMVTVPAQIRYFAADLKKNVDMGIAQICFFCRAIVTEPSKGWYSPSEEELTQLKTIYAERSATMKEKEAKKRERIDREIERRKTSDEEGVVVQSRTASPVVQVEDDDGDWLE